MDGGYQRGRRDARLTEHDHILGRLELTQIITTVTAFVGFAWLSLSTQRLGDNAKASAATAIALAQALKEEKDTARDTLATETTASTSKWSKSNTIITLLGVMVTALVGIGAFYLATR